jgi:hypothetical protein
LIILGILGDKESEWDGKVEEGVVEEGVIEEEMKSEYKAESEGEYDGEDIVGFTKFILSLQLFLPFSLLPLLFFLFKLSLIIRVGNLL